MKFTYEIRNEAEELLCEASTTLVFVDSKTCLLYTSDAADERSSVDLGGRRIIKKKNKWKCVSD